MARKNAALAELKSQIEALPPRERFELLRPFLTPQLRLEAIVAASRERTKAVPPREIARRVNLAVREVRAERRARQPSR